MTLNEYQVKAKETALYPDKGKNITYPVLGLNGEAGEVAEEIKKSIRDDEGKILDWRKDRIIKELGDVLWYLAAVASELDVTLDEVGITNLEKLRLRKEENKIHGSGSTR